MRATALSGGHNYDMVLSDEARCLRCSWEPYHTIPKTKSTSKRECICRCRVGVAHWKSRWKLASLNIAKQPIVGIPEIRFGKPGADWSETNREEWDSLVRRHERRWWNRNNEGLSEILRWSIEPARDSTTSAIESVYILFTRLRIVLIITYNHKQWRCCQWQNKLYKYFVFIYLI